MRVAVVTGANKGIGYSIVAGLARQFEGILYLTARNVQLGTEAVAELNSKLADKKCAELRYHQLDITDAGSIEAFRQHLKETHGGLDILVNNAGMAYKHDSTAPFAEQAKVTCETNFFGTLHLCEALIPLIRPHGRIVHVSSQAGMLRLVKNPEIKAQLASNTITQDQLVSIVNEFVKLAAEGKHVERGFPATAYGMSKVAMTSLSRIQQRYFHSKGTPEDVVVNACCPGYVDTDMTSHKGPLSTEEGAKTPIYLALLPANVKEPRGKFLYQCKEVDWVEDAGAFAK